MSVNKQLAPTLPDITPANEWSKDTQDELFKQATHATAPVTDIVSTPPSHAGGNVPESLVHSPEAHQPISPLTVGAGQPGYGDVPMYSDEARATNSFQAPIASPIVAPRLDDAVAATPSAGMTEAKEAANLLESNPNAVPLPGDLAAPTPPLLSRGESTASTVMEMPGSWGKDQPSSDIQSAGPGGADAIIADARQALNSAAAQAPQVFKNFQGAVGALVAQHMSPTRPQDPEAGIAGLLPAPAPSDALPTTTASPEETMSPAPITIPSPTEHKDQLHSPPIDGVPVGESRSNPGTTHVGNYAMTTLPNSEEGNVLDPKPGFVERTRNAVADAYNSEGVGAAREMGGKYLEMGMAAMGLGGAAAVAEKEEEEENVGEPTKRHTPGVADGRGRYISPAERAARGMGPAEAPEGNKYGPASDVDASEHPIQTTTTGMPEAIAPPPTMPSEGLTKPDAVDVPVGSSTYPSLEPYEGNKTSQGLEEREKDKPLPDTPGIAMVGTAPAAAAASTGVHFTPPAKIDTSVPAATSGSEWKSGVTGLNQGEVKEVQEGYSAQPSSAVEGTNRHAKDVSGNGTGSTGSGGESPTTEKKRRSSLGSKIKGVFSRHKNN